MQKALDSRRRRVLIIPHHLGHAGGGTCVGAWMIAALADHCDLSVLTWAPAEIEATNRHFGTNLSQESCRWHSIGAWTRRLFASVPAPLALLQNQILFRRAKQLNEAEGLDLVISGINEIDIGEPAIQYIHFPWSYWPRPDSDLRWYHFEPLVLLYRRLAGRISGYSQGRVSLNFSLANSDWTGHLFEQCYGARPRTLYPPVPGVFPSVPFEERKPDFVCIGRISPEKRIHDIIEILARVRDRGHQVGLRIVGYRESSRYLRKLHALAERRDWISFHHDLPRDEVLQLVSRCRFGIHGMKDEHFGIAVAELQRAGCIPFVRGGGGAPEIVDRDERLVFDSIEDAVAKIDRALRDNALIDDLRQGVERRRGRFTAERFVEEIRATVEEFCSSDARVAE